MFPNLTDLSCFVWVQERLRYLPYVTLITITVICSHMVPNTFQHSEPQNTMAVD
jgi:hypothetical protein